MTKKAYNTTITYKPATPRSKRRKGDSVPAGRSLQVLDNSAALLDKLDKSIFDDLFEKVNIGTSDAPVYAIRAKHGLYSDAFLSAKGANSAGTGSGGGASALSELNDVILSGTLATGDLLIYNGTHWVNLPQSDIRPDLSGYATQSWVEGKGYALTTDLTAHTSNSTIHITGTERAAWNKVVTDVAAITGVDSDNIINKWQEIVAFLDTYTEADTLANLLSNKVDKSVFDDMFEKVNIGTSDAPVYAIRAKHGLYSDAFLSAKGANSAGTGSGGGSGYDRLDTWADYTPDKAGYVLSAALGYDLNTRVDSLEAGSALSFPTSGSGNVVTSITKTGNVVNVIKGITVLTTHQPIYKLTLQRGGSVVGSYVPNSAAATLNIALPTFAEVSGKPSTLAGYGITDGINAMTISGSGNAVTGASINGHTLTLTKGATFLTSHQSLAAYLRIDGSNGTAAGVSALIYRLMTSDNAPTDVDYCIIQNAGGGTTETSYHRRPMPALYSYIVGKADLRYLQPATADATYATKLGISGNQIGTYVNGALGNLITVPNATKLNTYSEDNFFRTLRLALNASDLDTFAIRDSGTYFVQYSGYSNTLIHFKSTGSSSSLELAFNYEGSLRARFGVNSSRYSTGWKTVAYTDSNVASATKLAKARSLWGNAFDGTGDVAGDLKMASTEDGRQLTVNVRGGIRFTVATGGWDWGLKTLTSAGVLIGTIGAYGIGNDLAYWYMGGDSWSPYLRVTANGNVGVGISPSYKFDVAGTIHSTIGICTSGYVSAKGQNTTSDSRLKRRIADVRLTPAQIANAPAWRFAWLTGGIDVGSTAQYWGGLAPELTHTLPTGDYLGLDYGKAALLSVVNLAREVIDTNDRVARLEHENTELKREIAHLKQPKES